MELTHKHHIIPKHMGGTNDKSNIIELTVEGHAEAHRNLFEEYGNWQDYAAWQGLSGRMSKEEIIRYNLSKTHKGKTLSPKHVEILREKGKKLIGDKNPMYGKTFNHSEETKLKMSENSKGKNKGNIPWNKGKTNVFSQESIDKISKKASERHEQGKYDYERMGESRKGFKQSDFQKKRITETLAKTWQVTSPEGVVTTIINLRQFCKDNNLDQGNMSRGKHKGWKCVKLAS